MKTKMKKKGRARRMRRERRKGKDRRNDIKYLAHLLRIGRCFKNAILKPSLHSSENQNNLSFSSRLSQDCVIYTYNFGWKFSVV